MAAIIFFAVIQVIILALYHFGEVDYFWWLVLEGIWVVAVVLLLIGKWVNATFGSGV